MILETTTPLLINVGLKKRTRGIFSLDLGKEMIGIVTLNWAETRDSKGLIEIGNPVVGVRHHEVERIVAELMGSKLHPYLPATVHKSLGTLFPQPGDKAWIFHADDAEAVAAQMVAEITEQGLPFIQSMTGLCDICRALDAGLGTDLKFEYRRPVAWALAGDHTRAVAAIEQSLAKITARDIPAGMEYRCFTETLQEYMRKR
jgi:hypothetical protein